MAETGHCFRVAAESLMSIPHGTLVHGIVTGQGNLDGIKYSHAWVEAGDKVIDDTVPVVMNKSEYYAMGNIEITRKYSYKEALEQMVKTENYGPWDDVFEDCL